MNDWIRGVHYIGTGKIYDPTSKRICGHRILFDWKIVPKLWILISCVEQSLISEAKL